MTTDGRFSQRLRTALRREARALVAPGPPSLRLMAPMGPRVPDDARVQQVLDLCMRVGEVLLSSGEGADETTETMLKLAEVSGLPSVDVDITFTSITICCHRGMAAAPMTSMRLVRYRSLDLTRLTEVGRIVTRIDQGRLDVQVSSMGDARSLAGGVLLITPLTGADGAVYAVAQGAVQAGGFQASGGGTWVQRNQPTSGRVPEGASVEKAVIPDLSRASLVFNLKRPDFTTAKNIADVMNGALGAGAAKALDAAAVEVKVPQAFKGNVVGMIAKVELLEVEADQRAKIVISERTGTVVAGEHVRLRPAAVAQGGLQVTIQNVQSVSQPGPFAGQGNTAVINNASINADEESRAAVALPAATSVQELVKALNMLGSKPRDLIAILQALKAAGALDADLEVM